MFCIKNKIVLITGAASGIGASIVWALMEEDIKNVTILDIDEKNGLAIQDEINTKYENNKVKFIKCDVTDELEVANAFKTVTDEQGYIDLVINNAGLLNEKNFVKTIEVNCTAVVRGTVQAWNFMRKDEGGRGGTVINIASIAALGCFPLHPIYSATKAAVIKLGTTLGDELHYSRTGVRIVTACFGLTKTKMVAIEEFETFDTVIGKAFKPAKDDLPSQTPEHASQGVLEMYKKGKSGSVWVVTNGKPAIDVTDRYVKSNEQYNDIFFN